MPRQGMHDYTFGFTAPGESRRDISGNFFHVIDAPTDIEIEFNRNGRKLARGTGMGGSIEYENVTIHSPVAQSVVVALGFGTSFDSRSTVNANVTAVIAEGNTLPTGGDVAIALNSSAIILAADATRLSAIIQNISDTELRVGGNGVLANQGVPLAPGEKIVIDGTAIISAFNPDLAAAKSVAVLPIRQV